MQHSTLRTHAAAHNRKGHAGEGNMRVADSRMLVLGDVTHFVEMSFRNLWAASMSLIDLSAIARYTI